MPQVTSYLLYAVGLCALWAFLYYLFPACPFVVCWAKHYGYVFTSVTDGVGRRISGSVKVWSYQYSCAFTGGIPVCQYWKPWSKVKFDVHRKVNLYPRMYTGEKFTVDVWIVSISQAFLASSDTTLVADTITGWAEW